MSRPVEPTCVKSEENMKSIVQVNQRIDFFLPEFLLIVLKMPMLAFQKTLVEASDLVSYFC